METRVKISKVYFALIITASFVVVIAGMRAASPILVPFLLSIFIAMICTPPLLWMQRRGVPNMLAVFVILLGLAAIGLLLSTFIERTLNEFSKELPVYQRRLLDMSVAVIGWLKELGVEISDETPLRDFLNPAKAMQLSAGLLKSFSGLLKDMFMIFLTVLFILMEAAGIPRKLRRALGDKEESFAHLSKFTDTLSRYIALKTVISLVTGMAVWVWLSILGLDFAMLWGVIAFLLNYIPTMGSFIASIPAILLALIQYGVTSAILTAAGFLVINISLGGVIEPKFMGRGLGLSALVVFMSMVFWGWVLGPIGMFLSVPLTMIVKIALESNEDTEWIAVLLG